MSDHNGNKPVDASGIPADLPAAAAAIAEVAAPPLSPADPMVEVPKEQIAAAESEETKADAEVIMLPAKFAAFLATTATRFHERSLALSAAPRRAAAVALVAMVACGSALGGAMFVASGTEVAERGEQAEQARAVRESVSRIETELAALRSNIDRTAKLSAAQAGKTGERLDRIEKAQAEPSARLAKLTESVERLRTAAPATAPAVVAAAVPQPASAAALTVPPAREVTGSIAAQAAAAPVKPEPAAKPGIVDGWVLRDAEKNAALIEGRNGLLEVYAGDVIPGIGRVETVRRQDGKWVVVTPKGLIVTR